MNSKPEWFLYSENAFNPIFGNFTTNSYIMHIGRREEGRDINKIEQSFIWKKNILGLLDFLAQRLISNNCNKKCPCATQ